MAEMMSRQDQNKILDALNDRNLPFERYKFIWDEDHRNMIRLGGGGFGNVYACKGKVDDDVAIKVIGFQIPTIMDPDEITDCQKEVWIQRDVSKECGQIVKVIDAQLLRVEFDDDFNVLDAVALDSPEEADEESGLFLFILMERLKPVVSISRKGHKSLFNRLREMNEVEIVNLAVDIGRALLAAHSHSQKIIHRDVKLENVFWDGRYHVYKLGDFGIARATITGDSMTQGSGTLTYVAPEVLRGKDYDIKADMYSFGLMLYGLLNELKLPAVEPRVSGKPIPLPKYGSEKLQEIVMKACSFKPEDRYESMADVLKELEELQRYGIYQKEPEPDDIEPEDDIAEEDVEQEEDILLEGIIDLVTSRSRSGDTDVMDAIGMIGDVTQKSDDEATLDEVFSEDEEDALDENFSENEDEEEVDPKEVLESLEKELVTQAEEVNVVRAVPVEKKKAVQAQAKNSAATGDMRHSRSRWREDILLDSRKLLPYILLSYVLVGGLLWGASFVMNQVNLLADWHWAGTIGVVLLYYGAVNYFCFNDRKRRLIYFWISLLLVVVGALSMIKGMPMRDSLMQLKLIQVGLISLAVGLFIGDFRTIMRIIFYVFVVLLWIGLHGAALWGSVYILEACNVPVDWYWVGILGVVLVYIIVMRLVLGGGGMERRMRFSLVAISCILLVVLGALSMIEGMPLREFLVQLKLIRVGLIAFGACAFLSH